MKKPKRVYFYQTPRGRSVGECYDSLEALLEANPGCELILEGQTHALRMKFGAEWFDVQRRDVVEATGVLS